MMPQRILLKKKKIIKELCQLLSLKLTQQLKTHP